MTSLIAKLEAATGPSRELDAEIHRAITGMTYLVTARTPPVFEDRSLPPLYTSSIDAALTLVPDGCYADMTERCAKDSPLRSFGAVGRFLCVVNYWGTETHHGDTHDVRAIALCIAALRATDGGRG